MVTEGNEIFEFELFDVSSELRVVEEIQEQAFMGIWPALDEYGTRDPAEALVDPSELMKRATVNVAQQHILQGLVWEV
ncbi:hypothetical protein NW754_010283 [Fusarium falciforme]|uniref:Uncharacterized protein n=1 Tax=Fusarium falciforme TaxID=195108 RepID=A0A9W8V1N2_9HYPO|nr:hypothetical protein NW754_010283 [Fusarium falciforme]KAJ4191033.1 hypothetical protein NW755_005244 [Fusarium falciforme]KAJ4235504.1 hypothetical protein NW757_013456 [Fusarium falciforme]